MLIRILQSYSGTFRVQRNLVGYDSYPARTGSSAKKLLGKCTTSISKEPPTRLHTTNPSLRLPKLTEFPHISLSYSHLDSRVPKLLWSGERPRKGKVSVICRDLHDPRGFMIKNLDKDILATHPVYCSRGPLDSVVLD